MPYVPRPATTAQCAHCGGSFEKKHASRKYCSNSCNVQASYARTGYREGRVTRADLEQNLARMTEMLELMTGKPAPAPKAATPKPATKAVPTVKKGITTPAPAAKAAATKPKKKISAPALPKPAAKAAAKSVKKTAPAAELKPYVDITPAEMEAMWVKAREEREHGDPSEAEMVQQMHLQEVNRRRRAAGLPTI